MNPTTPDRFHALCDRLRRECEGEAALSPLRPLLAELASLADEQRAGTGREQMLRSFVHGQQEERRRIASQLHDGLCQYLTAVLLGLQVAQSARTRQETHEALEAVRRNCALALADTRRLIEELRPSLLEDFGLKFALERLGGSEQFAPLSVTVDASDMPPGRLPPQVESGLYEIALESVRNAAQHPDARAARLTLRVREGYAELIVPADALAEPWWQEIRTHAAVLGGCLQVTHQPEGGRELVVRVPLENPRPCPESAS